MIVGLHAIARHLARTPKSVLGWLEAGQMPGASKSEDGVWTLDPVAYQAGVAERQQQARNAIGAEIARGNAMVAERDHWTRHGGYPKGR